MAEEGLTPTNFGPAAALGSLIVSNRFSSAYSSAFFIRYGCRLSISTVLATETDEAISSMAGSSKSSGSAVLAFESTSTFNSLHERRCSCCSSSSSVADATTIRYSSSSELRSGLIMLLCCLVFFFYPLLITNSRHQHPLNPLSCLLAPSLAIWHRK